MTMPLADYPRVRKWLLRALAAAGVVAAIFVLRATVFAPEPIPVRVVEVARGRVEATVTNSRAGTVRARRRARLSPEAGGRVVELPFREGERVGAGDVVLRLDASTQRAQLAVAERELRAARARREEACLGARRAAREAQRVGRLSRDGIVSTDLLDQVESAREAAAAACAAAGAGAESATARRDLARAEADKTVLRAPFAGVVAELAVEVGEWTTPSPPALPVPPVIDLLDPSSLYVSAPLDEVDAARLRPAQPVRVTLDPYPGRSFPGRLVRVAPYVLDVEAQNRTVDVEVELAPGSLPRQGLLPGTSADVEVILETREQALRVPTTALIEGNRVLVVEAGRLVERRVGVGLRNWDWTEVVSGLRGGERIVASLEQAEVEAGARVVVEEEPPEP